MKSTNDLLSIGEVSKICRVSVKTLRHYDEVGLLKPALVDPTTSYRYYSVNQLPSVIAIKEMRNCGFSLLEAQMRVKVTDPIPVTEAIVEYLDEKLSDIDLEMTKLKNRRIQIESWKQLTLKIATTLYNEDFNKVHLVHLPERLVAYTHYHSSCNLPTLISRYAELTDLLGANSVEYHGPMLFRIHDHQEGNLVDLELCLQIFSNINSSLPFVKILPEGFYATTKSCGPMGLDQNNSIRIISTWAQKNGFKITGLPLLIFLLTSDFTDSPEQLIMEIQVPVQQCK